VTLTAFTYATVSIAKKTQDPLMRQIYSHSQQN